MDVATTFVLGTEGLRREHHDREGRVAHVVAVPDFVLGRGEELCVVGRSGAGKSTMLNLLAGIEVPTAGRVLHGTVDLTALSESVRDRFRARAIGYVFQNFNLVQGLSSLENVRIAAGFAGIDAADARAEARRLLERVGLGHRLHARPRHLSAGEQQRVAIARALVKRPAVVLADEPTASLDEASADAVLGILRETAAESGAALVIATHDRAVRERFERRLVLDGGGA